MKTIYKYGIPIAIEFSLQIPHNAKFLAFLMQPGQGPQTWWEVDTREALELKTFAIVGTFKPLPLLHTYLGTINEGEFIYHLYCRNS